LKIPLNLKISPYPITTAWWQLKVNSKAKAARKGLKLSTNYFSHVKSYYQITD
jgi:hypothetical protein